MGWKMLKSSASFGTMAFGERPSGKHTENYGKSPFSMGKSIINGHFQ